MNKYTFEGVSINPIQISTFDEYDRQRKIYEKELDTLNKLMEACLGLCGEVGEFVDIIKKNQFQGHLINDGDALSELGDVLWYLSEACDALGYSMKDVATRNIKKLRHRYDDCFSEEKSVNREENKSNKETRHVKDIPDEELNEKVKDVLSITGLMAIFDPTPSKDIIDKVGCMGGPIPSKSKEETESDIINHPSHYKRDGLETIDVIKAFTSNLSGYEATDTGNALKYLCRWKEKNGDEDLKKARWYINHILSEHEKE